MPLGNRKPLPSHKAFLINLLSLLATPLDAIAPADGVPGLLSRAIELAYEELTEKRNGRLYQKSMLPKLHEFILKENIELKANAKWWEVVDALFERGHIHEAIQAQRYAVPRIGDVATQIRQNSGIQNTYENETIMQVWRSLMDAVDSYIILGQPTQFDLGDAQVISLDARSNGGKWLLVAAVRRITKSGQAAVMYKHIFIIFNN